jgi:Cas10/Cmr2, second palm domain
MELEERLIQGFARAAGRPADEALRRFVCEGVGEVPATVRLLAWDANSIHSYVFDTTNATAIRGASKILERLDSLLLEGEAIGLKRDQVLFAGGGSGLAVVAAAQADPAIAALHRLYAERTLVATCTAVAVPLVGGEGFGNRVRSAGVALARQRLQIGPDPEPSVPFFVERCAVCGRRAAAQRKKRLSAPVARPECESCSFSIEHGKLDVRYAAEPSDFEALADEDGYVAVLYLDGNRIGRTISELSTPLKFAAFSQAMTNLGRKAFSTVADRFGLTAEPETNGKRLAYQKPISGGDDLVVILPAKLAIPFGRDLLAEFQAGADANPALAGLGASVGVGIGRSGFPIRHLLDEAEALLRIAKRRVYACGDEVRSALDFSVVRDGSPRAESGEPERWSRSPGELLLSGRPYTLEELRELSRRLRLFRAAEIGNSQLFALRRYAERGPNQFRNHVLYQIGRRSEYQTLVRSLAGSGVDPVADPAQCMDQITPVYSGRRVLDIADMIEIRDHWQEPEEEAAS